MSNINCFTEIKLVFCNNKDLNVVVVDVAFTNL